MKIKPAKTLCLSLLFLSFSLIPAAQQFDIQYPLQEGLSLFKLKDKYGYFDANNKVVIPCEFDNANSFSEGMAAVKKGEKWGFINKSATLLIPYQFEQAAYFYEGLAQVKLNGKFGFINKLGKAVIPFKYQEASYFSNGLAPVQLNGQWGSIDNTGATIIPFKYGHCGHYKDGLICVADAAGKYGYIDINGNVIIPLQYQPSVDFAEGMAMVQLNSKWGFIDKQGKRIVPIEYSYAHNFEKGYALVEKDDKWGVVDKTGKEVVPVIYGFLDAGKKKDAIASGKPATAGTEISKTSSKPVTTGTAKNNGDKTVKTWTTINERIKKNVGSMHVLLKNENFSLTENENSGSLVIYDYKDASDKYWVQGRGEVSDTYTVVEYAGKVEAVSFSLMAKKSASIFALNDLRDNFKKAMLADGFVEYKSIEEKFGATTWYRNNSRQLNCKMVETSVVGFLHEVEVYVYGEGVRLD